MGIEEIKLFLRIDDNSENTLIESFKSAAEEYLENAGVIEDYSKELYKLAIKLLVSHWYENRDSVLVGSISKKLEYSLNSILIQLQY